MTTQRLIVLLKGREVGRAEAAQRGLTHPIIDRLAAATSDRARACARRLTT